jgi:glycosyltransferase involved in cell wall biosynthesis
MTDAAVAASVRAGSTVIASYGGALASFGRVRALGGVAVLDQPIARLETVQAILREELERRPELAPTIEPELLRPAERERLERELELADLIVVGSRFAARSLEDHAARVLVAPYGVDSTRFAPAPPGERRPGPLRVLFCGQLTARKGIGDLLDAAALLDPARFGFVLAGPHVRGSSLGTLAPNVRVVGAVAPVRMPDLYRSADVFVLPSLAEGSAVVVLEAMASALPVVVTESTGADAVRDGCEGIVVPARAPEAIAAALERLAGDADLRERLGRTARARVLERDWTTFGACVRERVAELRESARV